MIEPDGAFQRPRTLVRQWRRGAGVGTTGCDMAETSRTRVRYSGRVQGVGFRMTARSIARGRSVTGWVRNEADGSVMLEAQGVACEVALLLESVRERMGMLIVSEEASEVTVIEGESSFVIRS